MVAMYYRSNDRFENSRFDCLMVCPGVLPDGQESSQCCCVDQREDLVALFHNFRQDAATILKGRSGNRYSQNFRLHPTPLKTLLSLSHTREIRLITDEIFVQYHFVMLQYSCSEAITCYDSYDLVLQEALKVMRCDYKMLKKSCHDNTTLQQSHPETTRCYDSHTWRL